ncbi:hypothetical protein EVAR_8311_1 [Eumeta japonica]|uniref:Uncharacterized protein n=1 Tax=Eumeta variegata TaxID=151549 RepID=A0A4C1VBH1_EUMVA|nr:hypothetical protein EVAR_8311_1 [Eumeta japonica]
MGLIMNYKFTPIYIRRPCVGACEAAGARAARSAVVARIRDNSLGSPSIDIDGRCSSLQNTQQMARSSDIDRLIVRSSTATPHSCSYLDRSTVKRSLLEVVQRAERSGDRSIVLLSSKGSRKKNSERGTGYLDQNTDRRRARSASTSLRVRFEGENFLKGILFRNEYDPSL